jgi:hypothetical protein
MHLQVLAHRVSHRYSPKFSEISPNRTVGATMLVHIRDILSLFVQDPCMHLHHVRPS